MSVLERFLRFFFFHFYHELAWTYDFVAWIVSLGQWNKWVNSILQFIEGPIVLELGHGPGHLQKSLIERGYQAYGLDESRQMLRQASHRLTTEQLGRNLIRGLAQNLPFPEYFNHVVATFPSEYIFDRHTLAEIYRVLLPGGQMIVLISAVIGGRSIPEAAARWLFRFTHQGDVMTESLWEHLKSHFSQAGFQVESQSLKYKNSTLYYITAKKTDSNVK